MFLFAAAKDIPYMDALKPSHASDYGITSTSNIVSQAFKICLQ